MLVIDNFKMARVYTACPPLTLTPNGNNVTVTWDPVSTGTVKLLSSPTVNGPWTEIIGAVSGHNESLNGGPKFFRTLWVPPPQ